MRHRTLPGPTPRTPVRPLRVLVEDQSLAAADVAVPLTGFEVTVCSGPRSVHDACPLVVDGDCPVCVADVVVSAIRGPWAGPVLGAWRAAGVPVVDARGTTHGDPAARLGGYLGAALATLALSPPED